MSLASEIGGFRAVRFAERFVRELHDGMWVSKPTLTLRDQRRLSTKLGLAINGCESAKDEYDAAIRNLRLENKKADVMFGEIETDPRFDVMPGDADFAKKVNMFFMSAEIKRAWQKRVNAALQLRECVNNALAQGILQTAPDLIRRLQECNEERQRFARQLTEFRTKRILPVKKDDRRREGQN